MNWRERLVAAGRRVTAPRQVVMQVLARASGPLTPQEILAQGQQICPHMGLVTVYRTLALFETMQLVRRVYADAECRHYVLASAQQHDALVCQDCGHAIDLADDAALQRLLRRLEARTGYSIQGHRLQLYGYCPACRVQHDRRA